MLRLSNATLTDYTVVGTTSSPCSGPAAYHDNIGRSLAARDPVTTLVVPEGDGHVQRPRGNRAANRSSA
jgi:hypothetical protein